MKTPLKAVRWCIPVFPVAAGQREAGGSRRAYPWADTVACAFFVTRETEEIESL